MTSAEVSQARRSWMMPSLQIVEFVFGVGIGVDADLAA